jgi:hypothetical protein
MWSLDASFTRGEPGDIVVAGSNLDVDLHGNWAFAIKAAALAA